MTLRIFITFYLFMAMGTEVSAITGIEVLEHYSADIMKPYHGEFEEQIEQEKGKKKKAEAAVFLIVTGALPISKHSLPTGLQIKDLKPVTPIPNPRNQYHAYKYFGFSKTRTATSIQKTLYMELIMAAHRLSINIRPLIQNAMKQSGLEHLRGPGKHLSLLEKLVNTLDYYRDIEENPQYIKHEPPIEYFNSNLDPKRAGHFYTNPFLGFFRKVRWALREPQKSSERVLREALENEARLESKFHDSYKRMGLDMEALTLFDYASPDKAARAIGSYLKEFKEGPHYFIRDGFRYCLVANTMANPESGIYRTLSLEIGKRVKADYVLRTPVYSTQLGDYPQEIRFINYLRGHDPNSSNHPENQELKAREGKIPLLEHLNSTTIVFSYPSPFFEARSVSPSLEPILSIRDEAPVLRQRYSIASLLSLKRQIASIHYMDVLAFYYIDSRHCPVAFPPETMHYIREGIKKELGFIEGVSIASPFVGPKNHLYVMTKSGFSTAAPRVNGWHIGITIDQSYIFEFDPSTQRLVRKIKCSWPILWSSKDDADKPQYVFIPSQGYLCAVVGSPQSLCNILIFDLIQGKEVTQIDFKSLLVDGDHTQVVKFPYLAVHSLAYFPDSGKLSASLVGFQSINQNKRLEVVIDLAKLLGY